MATVAQLPSVVLTEVASGAAPAPAVSGTAPPLVETALEQEARQEIVNGTTAAQPQPLRASTNGLTRSEGRF
jgi:hypothetical protein